MLPASVSLLSREMVFVTGKGGVGKTTVAAALGLVAARTGRRTIVCEVGGQARIPALLGARPGKPGEEVPIDDDLFATTIAPKVALEEWLAHTLRSRQLTALLARSNFFSAFVGAAPGAAELVAATKAWELAQEERWVRKRHGYDLVVLDGPASGHAVGMLRAPGTFADIARVGPIASQAGRVRDWLGDARRTAYLAVALPEELPVAETLDLSRRLDAGIGRRLDAVVVNGVLPDRFDDRELAAVAAAAG
jgi:anion-transporting  ArsA/GET3 family ATPase